MSLNRPFALTVVGAHMTDFPLSNARQFYSSMGNPLGVKGLSDEEEVIKNSKLGNLNDFSYFSVNELNSKAVSGK